MVYECPETRLQGKLSEKVVTDFNDEGAGGDAKSKKYVTSL